MVVLVRRFDPTGEELARWEVLVRDEDGRPEFFSPPKAKAAALAPPRNADLHIGDLIATMPAEAAGHDEYATGLYVVTPDGVKAAPKPPGGIVVGLGGPWLTTWGQNACVMLLAAAGVERRRLVMAACDCAETVLHLVPAGEDRPRKAVETARAWCRGEASTAAATSAAKAAAAATFASPDAASADATATASYAFSQPVFAFVAACNAAGSGTPREATLRALAPLVERWIPLPVVLLSTLGYPDAIPFDPGMVPASPTVPEVPRKNPSPTIRRTHRSLPRSRR
jgi:hypothetical protein